MTSPLMSGKARLLWPSLLPSYVPLLRVSLFRDYFQGTHTPAFSTKYRVIAIGKSGF